MSTREIHYTDSPRNTPCAELANWATWLYETVLIFICISVLSCLEWQLGSWKWKQEASGGIPRRPLLQRGNCFLPFGLLETRLREVLARSTTQTQFSVWHSGSPVSHMHADIHVNVRRHLTNTCTHIRVVQKRERHAGDTYVHPSINTHNLFTCTDTSCWHIYTLHKMWREQGLPQSGRRPVC